jgi:hypothetical protein
MAATDARPVPRKNAAFRFYFAIRKPADGTLITTWAGADSEVSLDGAAFSDCTNEATEIGTTGCGYIDLTSSEMNADAVVLKVTVTNTGAVPLVYTFFPEEIGDYRANVEQFGGTNGTFSGGRPEANIQNLTVQSSTTLVTGSHNPQSGDSYARIGANGAGLTVLATAAALDAVDNFIDTEIAAIIATLGTPAGASIAADLVVIDDFVDALESRLTAARAGYLDNINNANLANVPAFPSNFASLGINASGHVSRVTLVDTTTTNTDMITAAGIRSAVGLASANLDTQLAAIDDLIDTEIASIQSSLSSLLTTAMTESYRTDGSTGSVAQLLYELAAHMGEIDITSTTKRLNKIDGTTQAMTFLLNSATTPTAISRNG